MRRWANLMLLSALGAALVCLRPATGGDLPPIWRYWRGKLISGDWAYNFISNGRVLADSGPITGFAFGPGREEVAYCAPTESGSSALWVVSASAAYPTTGRWVNKTTAPRRWLWEAPEGALLRGPIWWAPNGSHIALLVCSAGSSDLVVVDYLGGEAVWLTNGEAVVDAVWDSGGEWVAYVTESTDERDVWAQRFPPEGPPRRLGRGGWRLRWSPEGNSVHWLSPTSATFWTEMHWIPVTGDVAPRGQVPSRPAGALWSRDGRCCAVLEQETANEEGQILLYRPSSTAGERLVLPHVRPQRLLCWSPDSRLLVVMGDAGFPIAVAAHPPAGPLEDLLRPTSEYSLERAGIIGTPMDLQAGPPAWSSAGDKVAYVVAQDFDERAGLGSRSADPTLGDYCPLGCLAVSDVACEHLAFMGQLREDVRRVLGSLKSIALSVQMYLADNNDTFPMSEDTDQFREVIGEYVRDELVFLCPGSEGDIAIEYLVEPGVRVVEVEDPSEMPVARATCFDDYEIIGYADGHVEVFEK